MTIRENLISYEVNLYKIDIEKVGDKGVAGGELCRSF
jgi:hypothetical protein